MKVAEELCRNGVSFFVDGKGRLHIHEAHMNKAMVILEKHGLNAGGESIE